MMMSASIGAMLILSLYIVFKLFGFFIKLAMIMLLFSSAYWFVAPQFHWPLPF